MRIPMTPGGASASAMVAAVGGAFITGAAVALLVLGVMFVDAARDSELQVPASQRWSFCQDAAHPTAAVSATRTGGPP
jgi:hypothetical protein